MTHVLLLDGHSRHVYNLDFVQLMKVKNVHVMVHPSHTTHALQPGDKTLQKFETQYFQPLLISIAFSLYKHILPEHCVIVQEGILLIIQKQFCFFSHFLTNK